MPGGSLWISCTDHIPTSPVFNSSWSVSPIKLIVFGWVEEEIATRRQGVLARDNMWLYELYYVEYLYETTSQTPKREHKKPLTITRRNCFVAFQLKHMCNDLIGNVGAKFREIQLYSALVN